MWIRPLTGPACEMYTYVHHLDLAYGKFTMSAVYSALPGTTSTLVRPPRKLLDQVRDVLRVKHYAYRTEQAYVHWIKRFILFHGKRHPQEMGEGQIEQFLTWLATDRTVAASTQTQALSALLFLYKHVLKIELSKLNAVRAKRPKQLLPHATALLRDAPARIGLRYSYRAGITRPQGCFDDHDLYACFAAWSMRSTRPARCLEYVAPCDRLIPPRYVWPEY